MKPILLVFAGRTKAGKTTLAELYCGEHGLVKATFSDVVRRRASQKHPGIEQTTRLLQDVGAQLVTDDPSGFCREACKTTMFSRRSPAVLDGLRHKSLLPHLRALCPDLTVVVVYVEASNATRLRRISPTITAKELNEIDSHPVEAEQQELRQVADLVLNTDRHETESYTELLRWLAVRRLVLRTTAKSNRPRLAGLLLRTWAVVSALWVITVVFLSHSDATRSWSIVQASRQIAREHFVDADYLPLDCKGLRGRESVDFFRFQGRCWMSISARRKFYPESKRVSDTEMISEAYQASAIKLPHESTVAAVARFIRALLFLPVSLLIIGFALHWVLQGTLPSLMSGVRRSVRLATRR